MGWHLGSYADVYGLFRRQMVSSGCDFLQIGTQILLEDDPCETRRADGQANVVSVPIEVVIKRLTRNGLVWFWFGLENK